MRASKIELTPMKRAKRVATGVAVGLLFAAVVAFAPIAEEPTPIAFESGESGAREPAALAAPMDAPHLLFITLDGVRPDEFFDCAFVKDLAKSGCSFPNLFAEVRAKRFEVAGMVVGNTRRRSLPGYQSIYSGKNQDATCRDNDDCAQVPTQTWLEHIRYARGLMPYQVASIASWNKMPIAVEKVPGIITVNAGIVDMMDPRSPDLSVPKELELESRWQGEKMYLPRWENARDDRFTFRYAQWYLTTIKPDVLAVGFLNSDELAHEDDFSGYKKQLRTYDGYIKTYLQDLKDSGLYDNTIVFVTTDHGRGSGFFGYAFQGHGPEWYLDHSAVTWAAISVPPRLGAEWASIRKRYERRLLTQLDIRPIVEELMIPLHPSPPKKPGSIWPSRR
ncbi:MAG: alkaline phosphatase family protein [Bdellovibrionales bacterium]|nr:alkaline phosphatase family protein [Bdellovibrionales bacterium]